MAKTTYSESDTRTISWDDDIGAAVLEWHRFTAGDEFRDAMLTVLECVEEHRGSKQLANSTVFKSLNKDDLQWVMEEWTPRAVEAGVEALAVVYPESTIAKMSHDRMEEEGKDAPIEQFLTNEVDEARQWLRSQ